MIAVAQDMTAADVEEVRDVIRRTALLGVDFFDVSARRREVPPEDGDEGRLAVGVQQRIGDGGFGVRLNADVVVPPGEASASLVGEYELLDGAMPSKRALQNFANEVAVMTIYPYLREAIATITAKVFGEP